MNEYRIYVIAFSCCIKSGMTISKPQIAVRARLLNDVSFIVDVIFDQSDVQVNTVSSCCSRLLILGSYKKAAGKTHEKNQKTSGGIICMSHNGCFKKSINDAALQRVKQKSYSKSALAIR